MVGFVLERCSGNVTGHVLQRELLPVRCFGTMPPHHTVIITAVRTEAGQCSNADLTTLPAEQKVLIFLQLTSLTCQQDPTNVDRIAKIQSQIDETKAAAVSDRSIV